MSNLLVLVAMLFFHIVDDYYLQGILATLKQKDWWTKNTRNDLYKYDYIIALAEHAFSWSFMIHIPVFVFCYVTNTFMNMHTMACILFINTIIHAIVDDQKANRHTINLVIDQVIHIMQVVFTWFIYFYL